MNQPKPATPTPDRCAQVAQVHRGSVVRYDSPAFGDSVVEWCESCGAIRIGTWHDSADGKSRVRWNRWRHPERTL